MSNPPSQPPCGTEPCLHNVLTGRLDKIDAQLAEIRVALIGDQVYGHKGIVKRTEDLEAVVNQHDRKLLLWGTGLMLLGAVLASVGPVLARKVFGG